MATIFRSPEVLRLEELVRKVKEGDIKLPKFQRPFVWKAKDVENLWDSIYRGYPIGSILLWLTKQRLASERELAELKVTPRAEEYPTNYLLDGQQRLSSLTGVLFWPGQEPKSIWNVAFDLKHEKFFHPQEALKDVEFPMNKLLETRDFINQCKRFAGHEEEALLDARAQQLLNAVKDYKIAAVVLADMDLKTVGPVFERINSKGRRLTIVDLMRAATWSEKFDINDIFKGIQDDVALSGFGKINTKAILQNVAAACGKSITTSGMEHIRDISEADRSAAGEQVRRAYRLAVDFLQKEVGVPSTQVLPYQLQLTLLAEFFRRRESPSPAMRKELTRWFWITSLSQHFQGANTTKVREDLSRIQAYADGSKEGLVASMPFQINAGYFLDQQFALQTATGKTFSLILAKANPKSLLNGAAIDVKIALAKANRVEFHHIFPTQYLRALNVDLRARNRLANICMLNLVGNRKFSDSAPSKYLAAAALQWGSDGPEILQSNLMGGPAYGHASGDKFDAFCEARADLLVTHTKMLIA